MVELDVKFRKHDKEPGKTEEKAPEKQEENTPENQQENIPENQQENAPENQAEPPVEEKEGEKKTEAEKFDLITIVESTEMDIPEKEPPYADILYDFIPESEQRVTANRDDHVSKKTE